MPKRKFVYDKAKGGTVEVTAEDVKPLCDELSVSVAPYKTDWLGREKTKHGIAKWPIHSEAMAVNVEEIGAAQAMLRKHGVQTDYDRLGRPILRDKAHRKAHARAMGFYDRDASYGDPEPLHYREEYSPENQRARMQRAIDDTNEQIRRLEAEIFN